MKRYWKFIIPAGIAIIAVAVLAFNATSNLVYFNTPTELSGQAPSSDTVRLGGQVVPGTVAETATGVTFEVTDGRETIDVEYVGAPQQLFQEGIGVVVVGNWDGTLFHSDSMLVKHDENYKSEDGDYDPEHPYGAGSDQA